MGDLAAFINIIYQTNNLTEIINQVKLKPELTLIYPDSIHEVNGSYVFLIKSNFGKNLVVTGADSDIFQEISGDIREEKNVSLKYCPLTVANSRVIRRYFPFTNPVSLSNRDITVGLGDRLGLATPGLLSLLKGLNVSPFLAQQSIRELNITGRNYHEILADAVWAVFQTDFQDGFGADGDHLKTIKDIKTIIDIGYTKVTLDCSDCISNLQSKSIETIQEIYSNFDQSLRRSLEARFSGKNIAIGSLSMYYTPGLLRYFTATYQKAINFIIQVYDELIKPVGQIDLEISLDEIQAPTDPIAHFFIAQQLMEAGVKVISLAPRFSGELQRGIDYIGDIKQFEKEYYEHEQIARYFGYKLSLHYGSDKFSLYTVISRESKRFHFKTAGTHWLEAIRVIIEKEPALYRQIHLFVLKNLEEVKKFYPISLEPDKVPDIFKLSDEGLKDLMNQNDTRQLIHAAFGLIMQLKDELGRYIFRNRIYEILQKNESLYATFLKKNLGKHLEKLGIEKGNRN